MKRITTLLMALLLAMSALTGCGNDAEKQDNESAPSSESTTAPSTPETPESSAPATPEVTTPEASTPEASVPDVTVPEATTPDTGSGTIGDYQVTIDSFRLVADYEGNDAVVIKYLFTNVSDEDGATFLFSISDLVFQNGISLPTSFCVDMDSDSDTKELMPGESTEVEMCYLLTSATADLEVEISDFRSDSKIAKTFSISDTPNQDAPPAYPPLDSSNNVDDYNVAIDSYRLETDWDGNSILIVKYLFTNVCDDDAACFFRSITDRAFQNGISLEKSYLNNIADNTSRYVKPGFTLEVEVGYELDSCTADVVVEAQGLFSFDAQIVSKTFPISDTPNQDTLPEYPPLDSANNLGSYNVVIDSCRLFQSAQGQDVVIVKYLFTNVSDEDAARFSTSLDYEVSQNGEELELAYFLDESANYDESSADRYIKTGVTLAVEVAYKLPNTTDEIVVEVSEGFSFDDTAPTLTKTFRL